MSDILQRVHQANPIFDLDDVDANEFEMALASIEDRWEFGVGPPRIPAPKRSEWMRPALVAAGAALLVIFAIAAPILFLRGEEQPVTDTTLPAVTSTTQVVTTTLPVTTTAPAPTTVPPPISTAPAMTWVRVPDQLGMANVGSINAITVGGPGLVAVGGYENDPLDDWVGDSVGVWTSADGGETWNHIYDPSFKGDPGIVIVDITSGPASAIVAVGTDNDDAVVLASQDGIGWERVTSDAFGGYDLQSMQAIVVGGPGFVAVGDDGADAGVWVSADGFEWTRVEDDALLAGDDTAVSMYDIAVGGPGLVAVGRFGIGGEAKTAAGLDQQSRGAAVWVSVDGLDWQRLPNLPDSNHWGLASVTSGPGGKRIIAFGRDMWTSSDGITWTPTERELPFGGPPPGANVAWSGDVALAAGIDMALSLWTSGDGGATWERVNPDDPVFDGYAPQVLDVVRLGERFIVVGVAGDYLNEIPAVWIGTLDG